jgi:hypothetical protein
MSPIKVYLDSKCQDQTKKGDDGKYDAEQNPGRTEKILKNSLEDMVSEQR